MKTTRREWLRASASVGAAAPFFLVKKPVWGYSVDEVESKLKKGKSISGVTLNDLPTPSLIIDLDRLEANIAKMAKHAQAAGINLRPHGKTHKCPEIAHRQIKAGALGLCAATISEAERMADAGVPGILITSESVGLNKIARLVRMTAKHSDTMAVVDNPRNVERLSEAAVAAKVDLNIMIDIDPVGRRTGVQPGETAMKLAQQVDKLPRLKLRGIHCYSGRSSHVNGFRERKEHSETVMAPPLVTFEKMRRNGLPVEIMSGASTGTYNIDSGLKGMTELQAGSYVFMDVDYRRIGGKGSSVYNDFKPSTDRSRHGHQQKTTTTGRHLTRVSRRLPPTASSGRRFSGSRAWSIVSAATNTGFLPSPNPAALSNSGTSSAWSCLTATPM